MSIKPWDEGVIAATNGMSLTANPYAEDTDAFAEWEAGYESVSDMDEDGEYTDDANRT